MQIKDPIIFLTGSLVGAGITYIATKKIVEDKANKKFEALYQEELQSVKESYKYLAEADKKRAEEAKNKPSLAVYTEAMEKAKEREMARQTAMTTANSHYTNYSNITTTMNTLEDNDIEDDANAPLIDNTLIDEETDTSQPYVLKRWPNPSESEYTQIEVTYYSDGTYADKLDAEMEIEDYIGKKMMDYVSNSDKDEIFIRNEELYIDIDITKDPRTYDEVMFG